MSVTAPKAQKPSAPVVSLIDPRIAKAVEGDRAAAQGLISEALPRVRNLVRYLVRGDGEVDDITQNVLIAVLRGLPTYRGEGRWSSWVDRITARETISYQKKRRIDQQRKEALAPELELVSADGVIPDEYLRRRELVRRLDVLPEDQRAALVLHHVLGLTVPEVGETMSVSFDTAKSRLRLGMKKLREVSHDDA